MTRSSRYLAMRDGVRIAIDVYLPLGLAPGTRLPAILCQTRYFRRVELNWPFSALVDLTRPIVSRFVRHGYAWVYADVRGTGASFGTQDYPWAPEEIRDGVEILDWIVRQPWSNGLVGTTGESYDGSAAEMLLALRHPALRACAPRFSLFDTFADVAFPGGIHLAWFTEAWSFFNRLVDTNDFGGYLEGIEWLAVAGTAPVEGDEVRLREAVAEHAANPDIHAAARKISARDDRDSRGITVDDFSPHARLEEIAAASVPVYSLSGWLDGAYAHAAVKRFLSVPTPGSRLTLGPWEHSGSQNVSPYSPEREAAFDQVGELLRFFDFHLRGVNTGVAAEKPVRYFTIGEERWKSAETWPPPEARWQTWRFGADRSLALAESESGTDIWRVDMATGTGSASRWNSLIRLKEIPFGYFDRREVDARLLCYDSAPLDRDLEITGHPIVHLFLESSAGDGAFFAYLEEITPAGEIHMVSEGQLRALFRQLSPKPPPYSSPAPWRSFERAEAAPLVPGGVAELRFDLLPVSYLVRRGHRLRVAIAGADRDHFAPLPASGAAPIVKIHRGGARPSRIELPVMPR